MKDEKEKKNRSLVTKAICFIIIGDTFEENIKRHEAFLALKLGLGQGQRVLVCLNLPFLYLIYLKKKQSNKPFFL